MHDLEIPSHNSVYFAFIVYNAYGFLDVVDSMHKQKSLDAFLLTAIDVFTIVTVDVRVAPLLCCLYLEGFYALGNIPAYYSVEG